MQNKKQGKNGGNKEEEFAAPLKETFSGTLHNLDDTFIDVLNTTSSGLKEDHEASEHNFHLRGKKLNKWEEE